MIPALIFDIETKANVLAELYVPPFDEDNVKTGNYGDVAANKKIAQSKAIYYSECRKVFPLHGVTGEILMFSYNEIDSDGNSVITEEHQDLVNGITEQTLLENFWKRVEHCINHNIRIAGFKIKTFDLPFVIQRSWFWRIVPVQLFRGKWYRDDIVCDLYDEFTVQGNTVSYGQKTLIKNNLNTVCAFLKIGQKTGTDIGKNFGKIFESNLGLALEYGKNDAYLEGEVYKVLMETKHTFEVLTIKSNLKADDLIGEDKPNEQTNILP